MLGLWRRPSRLDDRALGRLGERAAARFLRRSGYRVLGRNVRIRAGEADLVCEDRDRRTIVIVEVKTRRRRPDQAPAGASISPEASVGVRKRNKLVQVARSLARLNGWQARPLRIDVVAVEFDHRRRTPVIRHHRDAVRASTSSD